MQGVGILRTGKADGAVSVIVDFSDTSASWRNFGYQNNYEAKIYGEDLKNRGPFEFDLADYQSEIITRGKW